MPRALFRCTYLVVIAAFASTLVSCTDDPLVPGHTPTVTIRNLPLLPADYYYEIWVSVPAGSGKPGSGSHDEGAFRSIGTFVMARDRTPHALDGGPPRFLIPVNVDPNLIADAILTVQKVGVTPNEPGPRLLHGDFFGNDTHAFDTLTMIGREAFNGTLTDGFSEFVLDAPTSPNTADSASGLWFVRLVRNMPGGQVTDTTAGLSLRPLPVLNDNPGWAYQTWLVRYSAGAIAEYIPLGQFRNPSEPDANAAGAGAGANASVHYSAPGEDFVAGVHRRLNDGNYGVVVALEPEGAVLDEPGVVLLSRRLIDTTQRPLESVALVQGGAYPSVTIVLDR